MPVDITNLVVPKLAPIIAPYQLDCFNFLVDDAKGRGICAFRPGQGKSVIGTSLLKHYGGGLIGCLSMKVKDLQAEGKKWNDIDIQEYTPQIKRGNKRAKIVTESPYQIISIDKGKRLPELLEREWNVVVIDEAHRLKGESTELAKNWIPILHKAKHVILLTGTPLDLRTSDLFNLLHACNKTEFPDRRQFSIRYANGTMIQDTWTERGVSNQAELVEKLNRYMFCTNEEEQLSDLPFARHIVHFPVPHEVLPIKQPKYSILDMQRESTRVYIETNRVKQKYLWPLALKRIREVPKGQAAICFFWQIKLAQEFHKFVTEQNGIPAIYVDGDVSPEKRLDALLPCILGDVSCAVATYGSCGIGLNMSPGITRVLFMEMDRKYTNIYQCEGRVRRLGLQVWPAESVWFLAQGSHDQTVFSKLQEQEKLKRDTEGKVTHTRK
jgi:hypothetical protein